LPGPNWIGRRLDGMIGNEKCADPSWDSQHPRRGRLDSEEEFLAMYAIPARYMRNDPLWKFGKVR